MTIPAQASSGAGTAPSTRGRTIGVLIALAIVLAVVSVGALLVGAAETSSVIVTEIRAPRIALTLAALRGWSENNLKNCLTLAACE